ncbi:MAG: hypothetical protein QOI11_1629 [Candidatus Eremiobacteraeota bacterium]|jgi:hypothetical protein|nr:hypothetical protein [Candidatus Eremiobacteraeota bacterium]
MNRRALVFVAGALLAIAAPAAAVPPAQPNGTVPSVKKKSLPAGSAKGSVAGNGLTIPLRAQNGSGENGTATLRQSGPNVVVVVHLRGAPGTPQPAHVHAGTCAHLDPKPKYALASVVGGSSTTTVKGVTLAELASTPNAINVHRSAAQLTKYVACANITAKST